MSKVNQTILYSAAGFVLILQFFTNSAAQIVETRVKIESTSPAVLKIEGKFSDKKERNFSFTTSYAGIENLGARIFDIILKDKNGQTVSYKKLIDGEFLAENDFSGFEYRVKLDVPKQMSAYVSWLSGDQGILMPGDLLPLSNEKSLAKLKFEFPANLKISSNEKQLDGGVFEVSDVEKAIFFIGKSFRETELNSQLKLVVSGNFLFTDNEASKAASEIFAEYQKLFGALPNKKTQILLVRFPTDVKFGRWEAETRGANVTILSSDMPFNTQSFQRLHEQLRHEIFHLWMPNNLNLSGNYDWFYEGFALYQSLRLGVQLNKLRFDDFLDTLARAHSIDSLQTQKTSLIAASNNRWNGANTQVYARGMLVAFLVDIAILRQSKGKKSLDEILREIYQKHNISNPRTDGNAAILKILQSNKDLQPSVEKYIKSSEKIVWGNDLEAVGIDAKEQNFNTKLSVKQKPNGRQKDLLDKLGYNNWRKLSQKLK
jgi:hypothetical protein